MKRIILLALITCSMANNVKTMEFGNNNNNSNKVRRHAFTFLCQRLLLEVKEAKTLTALNLAYKNVRSVYTSNKELRELINCHLQSSFGINKRNANFTGATKKLEDYLKEYYEKRKECITKIISEIYSKLNQLCHMRAWHSSLDFEFLFKDINNSLDKYGNTALILVAMYGTTENNDIEIARLLIENGADVNVRNNHNKCRYTPLMYAAMNGYKELVELLVKNGADVNCKNDYGETALMCAFDNDRQDIIEFLLKNGANCLKDGKIIVSSDKKLMLKLIKEQIKSKSNNNT